MLLHPFMSRFRDVLLPLFPDSHSIRDAELRVRLHTLFIRRDVEGERGERDEKEGCRLYQLGAISDSESAAVITTDMAEILAIWWLLPLL